MSEAMGQGLRPLHGFHRQSTPFGTLSAVSSVLPILHMSMGAQRGQGAWTKVTHCQDSELGLAHRLSIMLHLSKWVPWPVL